MKKNIFFLILSLIIMIFSSCGNDNAGIPEEEVVIYAPATPSSIPIIIAVENMKNTKIEIFTNHPQAHALFIKGDVDVLVTGLSVGINFFEQDRDVKTINSYVSGLTYLLTNGKKVNSFSELKGEEIYIPFEGSPIDEITKFFVEQEGMVYGEDIKVLYSQPTATKTLMAKGQAKNAPLPEPLVTALSAKPEINVSINYKEHWEKLTNSKNGYPQVASFVSSEFIKNEKYIDLFNQEIANAIDLCKNNPDTAIDKVSSFFEFPPKILKSALKRTSFDLRSSKDLQNDIEKYYKTIGKPLDEKFKNFFYIN